MNVHFHQISDQEEGEAALNGLRVLALTSTGIAPEKHYIFRPLQFAKARWKWHIDLLASRSPSFEAIAAPAGRIFVRPSLSEIETWEEDEAVVAGVDARLREAENISGVPIGQVVLAADSKIGRAFIEPIIKLPVTEMSARTLVDNLEPFRAVRRLFKFADDLLEATKPDLVYSYEWAKPWLFVIWLAAQRRGIPCVALRRSKIRSNSSFLTTDRLMFNIAGRRLAFERQKLRWNASPAAAEYIRSFRGRPQMVQYIQDKWRQVAKRTWLSWHLQWARSSMSGLRHGARRRASIRKLVSFNRRVIASRTHQRFFQTLTEAELASMNYIYFPMHKETDLPVNFQAAPWFDQWNTTRLLASVIPSGYRFLVREHRHNYGLRPSRYYRELSQLPNVVLIDPFDSQFKYIKAAQLVVTENGSAGWEGLLLNRRVLTLSQTFYDGAQLATRVDHLDRLAGDILKLLAAPAWSNPDEHDRQLGCMVDSEFDTTFGDDDTEMLRHFLTHLVPVLSGKRIETTGSTSD